MQRYNLKRELKNNFFLLPSDNVFAMTIDGKTVFTHNETKPFAINYFGLGSTGNEIDNEVQFYYNCKSVSNFINFLFIHLQLKYLTLERIIFV